MNGEFPWEDEVLDDSDAADRAGAAGERAEPADPAAASAAADRPPAEPRDTGLEESVSAGVPPAAPPAASPAPGAAPDAAPAGTESADEAEAAPVRSGPMFDFEPPAAAAAPAPAGARGAGQPSGARRSDSQRQLVRKEYYAISEVSDLVGLPAHVLRYWESQFAVLNPSKNRSGNRVYQRKEIKLILLVKQLLHDEKYTVEGAKQKLEQLRRGEGLGDATARALDQQMINVLREELASLEELLQVDAP
jgi:DNA-binding transcriptional MerR regulator